jgi:hypothetical protein
MATIKVKCATCGSDFEREVKRGRPATRCEKCRSAPEPGSPQKEYKSGSRYLPSKISNGDESGTDILDIVASSPSSSSIPIPEPTITELVSEIFQYHVMVSNCGSVYQGNSRETAMQKFNEYVKKSNMGFGQIGCENVRLYQWNKETNEYETLKDFVYTKD